jgi:hypothetical protein
MLLLAALAVIVSSLFTSASAQPIEIRPDLRPVIRPDVLPKKLPRVCAPPRVMRNGRCVNPVRPGREVVCRPPKVRRGNSCVDPVRPPVVCAPPRVRRGNRCVDPVRPIVCEPPRVRRGNRCVMPSPMPMPVVCRAPRIRVNGRCVEPVRPIVCVAPRVRRGNRCVMPDIRPACRLPYVWSRAARRCILPVPIPPVTPPPACEAPWRYSAEAGGCICPSGRVVVNGACVRRETRSCSYPFVWSGSAGRCVCARGYSPYGTGCAPDRPTPSPQDNILWIQACLNAAGYDAGPEDGLAGRRTRSAWDAFRADENLSGAGGYTDPETLARLFEACRPEGAPPPEDDDRKDAEGSDTPETPQADPEDQKDADTDDGGRGEDDGDGEAGAFMPEPAQCATGKLYSLLSAEDASVEPCGRLCIPAPEGLSEEELEERAGKQGITWCQSCVEVEGLGLLCPQPEEKEPASR